MSFVPPILHQMWLDPVEMDNTSAPKKYENYKRYSESWRACNPECSYVFWNMRRVEELWALPQLARWKPFFSRLAVHIEKCDMTRYAIMYVYGGVYVDLDFQCVKSLAPLRARCVVGLVWEPKEQTFAPIDKGRQRLSNAFLMSQGGQHPLWSTLMDYIVANYRTKSSVPALAVLLNTGTARLALFARDYQLDQPQYWPGL